MLINYDIIKKETRIIFGEILNEDMIKSHRKIELDGFSLNRRFRSEFSRNNNRFCRSNSRIRERYRCDTLIILSLSNITLHNLSYRYRK